jgi:outer membrane immunogenic protein
MLRSFQLAGLLGFFFAAVSTAQAAEVYVDDPPVYVEPASLFSQVQRYWDGFYVGGFGGWLANDTTAYNEPPANEKHFSGWLAGGQVGFNTYLSANMLLGIVGDAAWVSAGGSLLPTSQFDPVGVVFNPKWQASVRGKLGFDAGTLMPYVTGGIAFLGSSLATMYATENKTHTGWTIGGGVDVAVLRNVFLTGEYRYASYGQVVFPNQQDPVGLNTHQAMLGVNLKF